MPLLLALTLALFCLAPAMTSAETPVLRVRPLTWAQPVIGGGPGNFYQVTPDLYRCEQPDDDQMKVLVAMGVKSVLCLRDWHDDQDEAKGTGLQLLRVPMDAGKIGAPELKKALDALRGSAKPVAVHCWHGSDRTGAVVAAWRMVEQGWSREAAIDEFVHGGFGYHQDWFPQLVDLLRTVDLDQLRAAKP